MGNSSSSASAVRDRDTVYIERALELARKGKWTAPPNPAVGAVVVSGDEVVGEGYHLRPGTPHAEIVALCKAGERAKGATLYATLEPCNHHGRTPPCTDAIVAAGIERVVVSLEDPCHHDCVGGIDRLRDDGVEVVVGVGREGAAELNARYLKASTEERSFVIAKVARTLDGRTMLPGRATLRVTGSEALARVGERRGEVDGVIVGSGTVLADDPRLSARDREGALLERQPARIVADTRLRMPPDAAMLREPGGPVFVVTDIANLENREAGALKAAGAILFGIDCREGESIDPASLLRVLKEEGMDGVMIEGGGGLLSAFAASGLIDLWEVWISPGLAGSGGGVLREGLDPPLRLEAMQAVRAGDDLLVAAIPAGD